MTPTDDTPASAARKVGAKGVRRPDGGARQVIAARADKTAQRPGRQGRPSRDEQVRRENLVLDVALEEFLSHGLDGANIEAVARKAGVGKSTIYRKYGSKQGLLLAVASRRMDELGERWATILFDIEHPEATLYSIALTSYLEWSGKSMPIYRIVYAEATRLPDFAHSVYELTMRKSFRPVADYFQRLQDTGFIDVPDATEAASTFLTIAAGGTRFLLVPTTLDAAARERLARDAVRTFLYGNARRRTAGAA
jgi:AcrR family transcriptional regulator